MELFKKPSRVVQVGAQRIVLQPKPKKGIAGILEKVTTALKPKPKSRPAPAPGSQPQATTVATQNLLTNINALNPQQKPAKKSVFGGFDLSKYGKKQQPGQQQQQQVTGGQQPQIVMPAMPKIEVPKAMGAQDQTAAQQQQQQKKLPFGIKMPASKAKTASGYAGYTEAKSRNPIENYINQVLAKEKGLDAALREQNINATPAQFVKRMMVAAALLSSVIAVALIAIFLSLGLPTIEGIVVGFIMAYGIFQQALQAFLKFPSRKKTSSAKNIERDILFACRDLIISLRSGMPLFNALTSVSTGYGDASKEFAKIVDRVQLGMPLEEAIDSTIAQTKSPSFRKVMLQASVSIKAGADVVESLQSVIDQLSQERTIELRAYGQKLNALAMFYMLFGVIMPSMGIAVITILTTFIALFQVNAGVLEFVLVGILFLQIVFLQMIRASRPVFTM